MRVNEFNGDNIAVFRELLIPFKGQEILKTANLSPEEKLENEKQRILNVLALKLKYH